jgi:F-type H+-transporting ATPase subunit b
MLIDWFTVIAQAINFLLLVWLLKRFLYQPILGAIDARETRIAAELSDAAAKKAEAKREREEFERRNEEFEQQRAALFNQAVIDAAAERGRLFDAARKDSDDLRAKRQEMLRSEFQGLNEEIARRTRAEVFAIARKILMDLAGASLEERMIDVFIRNLCESDIEEKERLASMFKSQDTPVLVRSAFDLSAAQRATIEGAVKGTFATEAQVRFEIVPDLVSGIELTLQGQKIAWSIADYLASLEKDVSELLKTQHQTDNATKHP